MEITPITIFYGSLLGIMLTALLGIFYRQGRSPTHNDAREMNHQLGEELRTEMQRMREEFREDMRQMREEFREDMRRMREELRAEIRETVGTAVREITTEFNRRLDGVNHRIDSSIDDVNHRIDSVNHRIDDLNLQIAGLRQEINRVLNALASHSHADGQVVITVQPDTEPAQVADN